MKKLFLAFILVSCLQASAQRLQFELSHNRPITIVYNDEAEDKATTHALDLLRKDMETVLSVIPQITRDGDGDIWIGTLGKSALIQDLIDRKSISVSELEHKREAFMLSVIHIEGKPILTVVGSDRRGTAYGILEVSRLMGVSPWEWWADVTPCPLKEFTLPEDFKVLQSPSVPYRGIFLNDEDWGLMPWSSRNYEPGLPTIGGRTVGAIGPKTYERIFQFLLRLRANTIWPAMHECTVPFFLVNGNKEMADDYGIYVGGSHCEPMMRSVAGEWRVEGEGAYNYVTNAGNVYRFFEERVAEVAHMDNIYTLGMRGIHDGSMQGAETTEAQKEVLTRVLSDQRNLLKQYVNKDLESVPQVFIPYKEVLDVYRAGLSVPDDVTLMWCDDNYGYIRHFPDEKELTRSGGHGIYYHVSYWGRPHDYLWLGTASPGLLYQQMKLAYEKGIRQMWILNVGDIKPSEYQIELFLDMAWDIEHVIAETPSSHLKNFLQREFGEKIGNELFPVMQEHYRLAYIRKPEFMGNTREEEWNDPTARIVKDLPWSEREIHERIEAYRKIADRVDKIGREIPKPLQDAYFELIKYPVQGAALMNDKILFAQLARHGQSDWAKSDSAYDHIVALTETYNALANGKWNLMMDHRPRRLPVFDRIKHEEVTTPLVKAAEPLFAFNGTECATPIAPQQLLYGVGYSNKAVSILQGETISFQLTGLPGDSIDIEIRLLPNHPLHGDKLRFGIALDNNPMEIIEYQTQGRSEEWKQNVLRNQAIRRITLPASGKSAVLNIKAIDEGVVLDQIFIFKTD